MRLHKLLQRLRLARDRLRDTDAPRLSVSPIARGAGLAPHRFIRLSRAALGETPHPYRSLAQIERAKHLLVLTDRSVTEVCMAMGFSRRRGSPPAGLRTRNVLPPRLFSRPSFVENEASARCRPPEPP